MFLYWLYNLLQSLFCIENAATRTPAHAKSEEKYWQSLFSKTRATPLVPSVVSSKLNRSHHLMFFWSNIFRTSELSLVDLLEKVDNKLDVISITACGYISRIIPLYMIQIMDWKYSFNIGPNYLSVILQLHQQRALYTTVSAQLVNNRREIIAACFCIILQMHLPELSYFKDLNVLSSSLLLRSGFSRFFLISVK